MYLSRLIDPKGKALTAKQQAWWDSLGVRHPQSERKNNVKLRKEVRQLTGEKNLLICLKCNKNIISSTQLKYFIIKWVYSPWSIPDAEWRAYTDAVNTLNNLYPDPDDNRTQYQLFVEGHHFNFAPAAHGGAAFLVWHREYLWRCAHF